MKQTTLLATSLAALSVISVRADVYWNNNNGVAPGGERNWANAANWIGGLPSAPGAGSAIVKPWDIPANFPLVSTTGNVANDVYIDASASLGITSGDLSAAQLVTGIWGNSGVVDVSGGTLNLSGYLNLGASGFDGKINISAGSVNSANLSINASGGAKLNLGGTGIYRVNYSPGTLGNVNYWIANNIIIANGGSGVVRLSTNAVPGKIVLTANQAPVAQNLSFAVAQGDSGSLLVIGGKFPPSDADNDPLTITSVGAVSPGGVGTPGFTSSNVTFSASSSFSGVATFSYTVSDGYGGSNTKTVTVTVDPASGGANITGLTVQGGDVIVTAQGVVGSTYRLQYTDALSPVSWQDGASTNMAAAGSGRFTLTNSPPTLPPTRYYRTRYVSGP